MQYIAKTFQGLEGVLSQELAAIGATDITPLTRAVAFRGSQTTLYKANIHLRTALRILWPIHEFEAHNEQQLYRAIYRFDWQPFLSLKKTFAIDCFAHSRVFTHSKYAALKTKDAICDQFRKKTGARPNVDRLNADTRLHIHINNTTVKLSLDASGSSLHKRGFRSNDHKAPINEVLAAGMVLLSGWDPNTAFVDPMCGSGTIALEAGLIAQNQAPNLWKKRFACQNWRDYSPDLWQQVIRAAEQNIRRDRRNIWASDAKRFTLRTARKAAQHAQLSRCIQFRNCAFEDLTAPAEKGVVILNPPYGERMAVADIGRLYKKIGDQLKQEFAGYDAWIISSNKEALKHVGLRPSRKITLFNGPLACKFQKYELYRGSRKQEKG